MEEGRQEAPRLNYYPHHIGDYLRDTAHLTLVEHGAYRRMLDLYYASEKPLPLDVSWLCRLVRADSEIEREAVQFVLSHFFQKGEEGWRNKRADAEIKAAYRRAKVARENGKRGGRPKTQRVSSGLAKPNLARNPDESSQKPITNNQNQKPKEEIHADSRLNGAHHPKVDDSPLLETLPLREGGNFEVRQSLVRELEPLYPAVDVGTTIREMKAWLVLNTERRKTRKGIRRFMSNWLQSEQEKHGG